MSPTVLAATTALNASTLLNTTASVLNTAASSSTSKPTLADMFIIPGSEGRTSTYVCVYGVIAVALFFFLGLIFTDVYRRFTIPGYLEGVPYGESRGLASGAHAPEVILQPAITCASMSRCSGRGRVIPGSEPLPEPEMEKGEYFV